jgi:hypothetical protein
MESIIAIGEIWRAAIRIEDGRSIRQRFDPATAFLTILAIANGAQDRLANGFVLDTPASARRSPHRDRHMEVSFIAKRINNADVKS